MLPHLSRKNPERESFGVFTTKLLFCVDGAHLAVLAHTLELDLAVDQSEQGVVLADTDVVARMNVRASLKNAYAYYEGIPTLTPGWMWVPRWRTRMLPARTN